MSARERGEQSQPDSKITRGVTTPLIMIETKNRAPVAGFGQQEPFSHFELLQTLTLVDQAFGSQRFADYLVKEANAVADRLSTLRGFSGAVCTGYPFYVMQEGQPPAKPDEYTRFLNDTKRIVIDDYLQQPDGWACPPCQAENVDLPDLKTICKPCTRVTLKPRDIFKALPDLDIEIIVDQPDVFTEGQIERTISDLGYAQSDINIQAGVERTQSVLSDILNDVEPSQKIPVDVHIWAKQDFMRSLDELSAGKTHVELMARSLHMQWEDYPFEMWHDFVFQMAQIKMPDQEISDKISSTQRAIKGHYSTDEIVAITRRSSTKAGRLLATPGIEHILRQRVEGW